MDVNALRCESCKLIVRILLFWKLHEGIFAPYFTFPSTYVCIHIERGNKTKYLQLLNQDVCCKDVHCFIFFFNFAYILKFS